MVSQNKFALTGGLRLSFFSTSSHENVEAQVWDGEPIVRRLSEQQKKIVAFRQKYSCASCYSLLPPNYEIDHIRPLALGGIIFAFTCSSLSAAFLIYIIL